MVNAVVLIEAEADKITDLAEQLVEIDGVPEVTGRHRGDFLHGSAVTGGEHHVSGSGQGPVRRAEDLPVRYNAVEILERNLTERADEVALLTPERELTFGEVALEVNRAGNALVRIGVRPGDAVAILSLDTAEWPIAFFACLKVGAITVGMNSLLTSKELAYMLRDSGARVLLVHATLLAAARSAIEQVSAVTNVVVIGGDEGDSESYVSYEAWIADESTELDAADTHREDFGTLNYSSGTTGQPKGILHAHQDYALTAQLWGVDVLGLVPSDRTFSVAKLFFTFGLGGNLVFPWSVGASTALYSGSPRQTSDLLEAIDRFQPTILFNAPTGYAMMLATEDLTERYDLTSLRLGVSAGEALPAVPRGEIGNLQLKGETAALSYLHDAARSRETFMGEWLHTGDKYYEDEDGYFWHAGRTDDMLKVGGIWVSPVEVESTLIGHEAVLECAVVGVTDDSDLVKPKAYVVLQDGHTPGDELTAALVAHCVAGMAAYKRPRWIEYVDELPKTATGKIQRYRLR